MIIFIRHNYLKIYTYVLIAQLAPMDARFIIAGISHTLFLFHCQHILIIFIQRQGSQRDAVPHLVSGRAFCSNFFDLSKMAL